MTRESLECWFYRRMVKELTEIQDEHKTNSIDYVIGMLTHDIALMEKRR